MQNHFDKDCLGAPDNAKSKQNVNSKVNTTSTTQTPTIILNTFYTDKSDMRKLANDLLDNVYEEVKSQTDEQIFKAKTLCMVSDGEEFHTDTLKIDEIKTIVDNAKMIVNYFKFHVQAAIKLKRIQVENYNKEIALVYQYLHDRDFWDMLDTIIKILESIVVTLKLFELDSFTLSIVYFHFNKLMNQVSELSYDFSDNI
ncbi:hypothetical protein RCL_jg19635.t1 [Rhizophagus clarus]|uniref:Uncharacterized protein n=1 Tax=Rhizophagus clarus TaxID=94130 RepID=A0A8H3LMS5_9GLOM|nr:hypothetical protein RCL_jg19635.t1 [Rhizophagus clarus]